MRFFLLAAAFATAISRPLLAAPVQYAIESNHTYPSIKAPHMGISYWRGKFNKTSGSLVLDREAGTGAVDIVIDAASIDLGHDKLNEHLRSEDVFNVAKHPSITYKGPIRFDGDKPASVEGQLSLLGVTRPVKVEIESFNCIDHPFFKKEVCGADAKAEFNRADFGMTKYADGDLGKVRIEIQVEAVRN